MRWVEAIAGLAVYSAVLVACDGGRSSFGPDTIAPGTVINLVAIPHGDSAIVLVWTAPGDDEGEGQASVYEVRSSPVPFLDAEWDSLTPIPFLSPPSLPGTPETLAVTNVPPGTKMFFGLRAGDEVPNWSRISNQVSAATFREPPPLFVREWGRSGTEDGEFTNPGGISLDAGGNVWVADTGNHRIQEFSPDGSFLRRWGDGNGGARPLLSNDAGLDSVFFSPRDVSVDPAGQVYVVDLEGKQIQVFSGDGVFLRQWSMDFNHFASSLVASSSWVYVADWGTWRQLIKYTPTGERIWSLKTAIYPAGKARDLALSPQGWVYLANERAPLVQVFSDQVLVHVFGAQGVDPGRLSSLSGISVDPNGDYFVTEEGLDRVQKYRSDGTFLTLWGETGSKAGQFVDPGGVAVGASGQVYVLDSGNARIQVFQTRR